MLNFQTNPMLADATPAMSQQDLQIHSTCDLNIFKILEGNRNINLGHVERLVKSIQENGFLKMPIIVNDDFEVIDGQHRLMAARKTNSMIYYIKEKSYDLNTAIVLNRNSSNWSIADYIKSYCDLGFKDYITLQQFYEANKDFNLMICAELTSLDKNREIYAKGISDKGDLIRKGYYKFDPNNKAEYIFNAARKIKSVIPDVTIVAYLRTLNKCMNNPEFNLNQFVKKAITFPDQHRRSSTSSVILSNIEHIYNFRNQGKTRIILQK
jgi:hypothetical protein